MILNNAKIIESFGATGISISSNYGVPVVSTTGDSVYSTYAVEVLFYWNYMIGFAKRSQTNPSSSYGDRYLFHLGNGTTLPTKDDYALESEIYENITVVKNNNTITYDANENEVICNIDIDFTFQNDTGADITISEIGITAPIRGSAFYRVLVCREVLDTPLVVSNGAPFRITKTLSVKRAFPSL